MKKTFQRALLCGACGISSVALAEVKINGFASVGGGYFDSDTMGSYGGVGDSFASDPFNKLGLQVKADINSVTSVTGQLVAKGAEDYNIEAEWLYATFSLNDSNDFRLGRIRVPYFYYSDFLDVGYAYPWITPPREVYNRIPFSTIDGGDFVNTHDLGIMTGTFQVYYGDAEGDGVQVENAFGFNYSLAFDWLTLRASYNIGEVSIDGAFEEDGAFYGLAANVDLGGFLFNTEITQIDMDDHVFVADDMAYHAMLGYRFGNFIPHITYAVKEEDELNTLDLSTGIPVVQSESTDSSLTIGLRYDYSSSTALKIEYTQVDNESPNYGIPGFIPDPTERDGELIAFVIDTVF